MGLETNDQVNEKIMVLYEATPNPQSLKFVIDRNISVESVNLTSESGAQRSPLAHKIFGFPWADAVFIGPNFVTITKQDWVEWDVLADPLADLISEHLESGEAVLYTSTEEDDFSNDPPVIQQIKSILNHEIRPAVAMDGGDIIFDRYEDNVLYLQMLGACSGCPSSTMTLKQGVETRMREAIPEIKEVVAV